MLIFAAISLSAARADDIRAIGPNGVGGSSKGVVVADLPLVHVGQCLPIDASGRLPGRDQQNQPIAAQTQAQTDQAFNHLAEALGQAGIGLDRLVKLNIYAASVEAIPEIQRTLAKRFQGSRGPAISFVETRSPRSGVLVAMDGVAVLAAQAGGKTEDRVRFIGDRDRKATVMPPGVRIHIAGQAEKGSDLKDATRKTLTSLSKTLAFLGRGDADIAHLKAFLKPMTDAEAVQAEVAAYFAPSGRPAPPLTLVEWDSGPPSPIEIELVAWGGEARDGEPVDFLTPPGMTASPVFSRVARINRGPSIYISGLLADKAAAGDAEAEVVETFQILQDILKQAGSDFRHLAKATYYVSSPDSSRKLNELRPRYYDPKRPPSASKAGVVGVGRAGRGLTLDMIAVPIPAPSK